MELVVGLVFWWIRDGFGLRCLVVCQWENEWEK